MKGVNFGESSWTWTWCWNSRKRWQHANDRRCFFKPSTVLGQCCILVRAPSFNDPSGVRRFWKKFLRWPGLQMRKQTPRQDIMLGCFERGRHALSIHLFQLRTCQFLCIAYLSLSLLMFCHRRRDRHNKDENTRHCSWQIKTDLIDAQKFKQASQQMHCHPFRFLAFLVNLEARWGCSLYNTYANAYEFSKNEELVWSLSTTPGSNILCCN